MGTGRQGWERRYRAGIPLAADWFTEEPPEELVRLVSSSEIPDGRALDVGCGPGSLTCFLAQNFPRTVGLDFAYHAVVEARRRAAEKHLPAAFLVGAAPTLPFVDECFTFVLDRGCMHALPPAAYGAYMLEVARVLDRGGVFDLYFYPQRLKRRLLQGSLRGLRRWAARKRRARRREEISEETIRRLASDSLEMTSAGRSRFVNPSTGREIDFVHAVFRKRT